MFLEIPLQKLGLTEKEARVYLAALELGGSSVQDIAKKAGVKRPTTYVILETLKEKGLIFEEKQSRRSEYFAESPDILKKKVQEQKQAIDESMPFLQSMYNSEKVKPKVLVYEGVENMKRLYLETLWKSKTEILFFASIKKIKEKMPGLLDIWVQDMARGKKFQNKTREILNADPIDIEFALEAKKVYGPDQKIRILPPGFLHQFAGADNAIFEDKIMMISFEEKLFTTVIQSKVLADTFRALYELAWIGAVPIDEVAKMGESKI